MKAFDKLVAKVEEAKAEVEKVDNGTKAAVPRLRKAMMEVKKLAQDVRVKAQKRKEEMKGAGKKGKGNDEE